MTKEEMIDRLWGQSNHGTQREDIEAAYNAGAAANPATISELLDRLEAAEKERDALRAKIEAAEKSDAESLAMYRKARDERDALRAALQHEADCVEAAKAEIDALSGAQNVPKAVAYLDLGTGGYMDIGTDLTDEALSALPKGRHMLGIVGTYGVDGYAPAQPAPSDEYFMPVLAPKPKPYIYS